MAWKKFPCLGFQSDLPVTTPGYLSSTDHCVPTDRGIGAAPSATEDSTTALNGASMGGGMVTQLDDTQYCVIGTATKLYSTNTPTPTTLTDRSGFAYAASTSNSWMVTQFGNVTLAANRGDFLQFSVLPANFASVGAAPVPKASIVITAGPTTAPFVMVGDYDDGVNADKDGWKCSALADYTNWTASMATQSAFGRLLDGVPGRITAMLPYRDGVLAWKRTGMYLGSYTGPPNIWSWQRISSDVGCIGKNACVEANDIVYFADEAGVWMFDGSYPRPIGPVSKWWANSCVIPYAAIFSNRNFVKVIWDKPRHLIWFLTSNMSSIFLGLAYNTVSKLWTMTGLNPITGNGGGIIAAELIAPRFITTLTANKIGTVAYAQSAPEQSLFYSWLFSDTTNNPLIRGVRPAWTKGPSTATNNWVSGAIVGYDSDVDIQPGSQVGTVTTNNAFTFRQPGRMDGVGSAERLVFWLQTNSAASDWELSDFYVDIGTEGVA